MKLFWQKWRDEREKQRLLNELWRPEYDLLAHFNSAKGRGVVHDPQYVEQMAEVQRHYDEVYMPASREVWERYG